MISLINFFAVQIEAYLGIFNDFSFKNPFAYPLKQAAVKYISPLSEFEK
jgi:hypothetical protein